MEGIRVKGMGNMNQTRKSLLQKTKPEMSDYSLVATIISVSFLMAFITLPNEMMSLLKGAFAFLLK